MPKQTKAPTRILLVKHWKPGEAAWFGQLLSYNTRRARLAVALSRCNCWTHTWSSAPLKPSEKKVFEKIYFCWFWKDFEKTPRCRLQSLTARGRARSIAPGAPLADLEIKWSWIFFLKRFSVLLNAISMIVLGPNCHLGWWWRRWASQAGRWAGGAGRQIADCRHRKTHHHLLRNHTMFL